MKNKRIDLCLILAGVVIFVQFLVMVLWKEHSFIAIHDNLDLFIPQFKMMNDREAFFLREDTLPFLGGISRNLIGSEWSVNNLLYYFFSPYTAYVIAYLLKIIIGFTGIVCLGKELLKEEEKEYRSLLYLVGISFGMIPVFPTYGISFVSQPFLLIFLLKAVREKRWYWYTAVFLYPLFSYFSYFGIFILGYLAIAVLWAAGKKKREAKQLIINFILLAAGYVFMEYRLFLEILFSDTVTIRESMVYPELSAGEVLREIISVMANPGFHAEDSHRYVILPAAAVIFLIDLAKRIKEKRLKEITSDHAYLILGWIILNCIIYGLYMAKPVRDTVEMIIPVLRGFQFNRTIFLNPFLWYMLFFFCLRKTVLWWKKKGKIFTYGLALAAMFAVMFIPQVYNDFYHNCYHHAYEIIKGRESTQLSFEQFYSEELFENLKEEINYQGEWSAAYGMHPAVLYYNGISTLDGYLGLYSQEYKEKFGKMIAPALTADASFRQTFDHSGIRAYLYSGTGRNTYEPLKELEIKEDKLWIDGEVFKEMQGVYIFSRIKITDPENTGVSLIKEYTHPSSPYIIYVYRLYEKTG